MQVEVGMIYDGKVTGITNFGAFVQLQNNQSGLVHISEISRDYVSEIRDHVNVGDAVKVMVLSVEGGKIALSIKKAASDGDANDDGGARTASSVSERKPMPAGGKLGGGANTFEDMMSKFKTSSDEKFRSMNSETKRRRVDG